MRSTAVLLLASGANVLAWAPSPDTTGGGAPTEQPRRLETAQNPPSAFSFGTLLGGSSDAAKTAVPPAPEKAEPSDVEDKHEDKHEGKHDGEHEGKHDGEHDGKHDGEHDGKHDGEHEGKHDGEHDGKHDGEHDSKHEVDELPKSLTSLKATDDPSAHSDPVSVVGKKDTLEELYGAFPPPPSPSPPQVQKRPGVNYLPSLAGRPDVPTNCNANFRLLLKMSKSATCVPEGDPIAGQTLNAWRPLPIGWFGCIPGQNKMFTEFHCSGRFQCENGAQVLCGKSSTEGRTECECPDDPNYRAANPEGWYAGL